MIHALNSTIHRLVAVQLLKILHEDVGHQVRKSHVSKRCQQKRVLQLFTQTQPGQPLPPGCSQEATQAKQQLSLCIMAATCADSSGPIA
jgi:hypothetical protein